jgi:mannitol 2-dehydrogenase
MKEVIDLNSTNLQRISGSVEVPSYNRSSLKTGIAHIGIGAFHRSHEAYYTDRVLNDKNANDWGICGIALLENDYDRKIFKTLEKQNGLYTLMVTEPDGSLNARIIGSIVGYLFAPDDPGAAIMKLTSPEIKIITLTITEGGYNFNTATGDFQFTEPSVQWDITHPEKPVTIFGYLTQALKLRQKKCLPGVTIQSCDNIQKNGDTLKRVLLSYINTAEPELISWVERNVTFPNSMVDRITPVTLPEVSEIIIKKFGFTDSWPVVSEPFIQWIVEDNFCQGRPSWEKAGVQFVHDVGPYEKMKIRLLNAGHSILGFLGSIHGCTTVDEAVRIPHIKTFLRDFMDHEATPLLGSVEGINLEDYKETLLQRFGNPFIKDQLSRICSESSAKIPKFLLPTINEHLQGGGPIKRGTLVVAAWCRYLELAGDPEFNLNVQDKAGDILLRTAGESLNSDPLAFLKNKEIFGDLVNSERFVNTYLKIIDVLRKYGIETTIRDLVQIND